MIWYVEIVLQIALGLRLQLWPDGRPAFERLVWSTLAAQVAQWFASHSGRTDAAAQVWYCSVVILAATLAPALIEAGRLQVRWHGVILAWWTALFMACAWLRFYPYTGYAMEAVNIAAYLLWLSQGLMPILRAYQGLGRSESRGQSAGR